jgi:hypothetical protein
VAEIRLAARAGRAAAVRVLDEDLSCGAVTAAAPDILYDLFQAGVRLLSAQSVRVRISSLQPARAVVSESFGWR